LLGLFPGELQKDAHASFLSLQEGPSVDGVALQKISEMLSMVYSRGLGVGSVKIPE